LVVWPMASVLNSSKGTVKRVIICLMNGYLIIETATLSKLFRALIPSHGEAENRVINKNVRVEFFRYCAGDN
jgi:hypothetical protein